MAYPTTLDAILNVTDHITRIQAADVNVARSAIMAIENILGYGATLPTVNPTANTIAKRDASGNTSFNLLLTTGGIQVPRSSPSAPIFGVDAVTFGSTFTIANNATAYPFGLADVMSGLFVVKETASDHSVFCINAGHALGFIVDTSGGALFTTNPATGSRVLLETHGTLFCPAITNKLGSTKTFIVACLFRWDTIS